MACLRGIYTSVSAQYMKPRVPKLTDIQNTPPKGELSLAMV